MFVAEGKEYVRLDDVGFSREHDWRYDMVTEGMAARIHRLSRQQKRGREWKAEALNSGNALRFSRAEKLTQGAFLMTISLANAEVRVSRR